MTLEDLAAKLDEQGAKIDAQGAKLDAQVAKLDAQGAKLDAQGAKLDDQSSKLSAIASEMDARFNGIDQKMDDGFNNSRIRDEKLRDLMKFGLEARDALRDQMHHRFDDADRKHDLQITLLNHALQHVKRPLTVGEVAEFVKQIGLSTPSESAQMIREDRDDPDR